MEQLQYQPLCQAHANDLTAIWSDMDVIRYTNIKTPCTAEEINTRIALLKDFDVFAVSHGDGLIGVIGCPCIDPLKLQYGIFYQFRASCWGQGYATAATEWLLNFMKRKYGCCTLFADVVAANIASEKILAHFKFQRTCEEGIFERDGFQFKLHHYTLSLPKTRNIF